MNLPEAIRQVIDGKGLSRQEMESVMSLILDGKATPVQVAAFLVALRCKGESIEEILGAVEVMRHRMTRIQIQADGILDTCGTGGDCAGTLNVSTLSALVAAGAGVKVAKHGNRSISSQCGSADLFEALGVKIDSPVEITENLLKEIGIAFLFAPLYHPAMKNVASVRKELGIRTLFNILGPLCNPAGATHQLIGVFSPVWLRPIAEVLGHLGSQHVIVVYGTDGMDEISIGADTKVCEWNRGKLSEYQITPEVFGIEKVERSNVQGGSASQNREMALKILEGQKGSGRDLVVLNSAAALFAADRVTTIQEGIQLAQETIDSGKALEKLELLRRYSQRIP